MKHTFSYGAGLAHGLLLNRGFQCVGHVQQAYALIHKPKKKVIFPDFLLGFMNGTRVHKKVRAGLTLKHLVCQPSPEELQEDPLRPAVVAGVGRAHLAVPVVREACARIAAS